MVQILVPPQVVIRRQSWQRTDPKIIQRSEFTGSSRELLLGPAARWSCSADIVTRTLDELNVVRGFLAEMSLTGAFAVVGNYPAGGQQTGLTGASATALIAGGGQLGIQLNIDGLAPSTLHARKGHLINFGAGSGPAQVCVLRADLWANAAGQAQAQLDTPIRRSPVDNDIVHLRFPFHTMRLARPMAWNDELYQLAEIPPLQFEEYF